MPVELERSKLAASLVNFQMRRWATARSGAVDAMRTLVALGAAPVLATFAGACNSAGEGGSPGQPHASTGTPSATDAAKCPLLTAGLPADLVKQRVHVAKDMGTPAATGVIWTNGRTGAAARVANIGAAPSDEVFGDGAPGVARARKVQGEDATEIISDDVHQVRWRSSRATSQCRYWSVVAQGLTSEELEALLSSIREQKD